MADTLGTRSKIIACETVADAIRGLIPTEMESEFLAFGLHIVPDSLHDAIQKAIDTTREDVDTILLGYGLCSKGAIGLQAHRWRLVVPKVDDCIALFLGSRSEYRKQCLAEPGTFYLTKGWIECGDDPYTEYLKMVDRYGPDKAFRLEKAVIANYTRLAFIHTVDEQIERYRAYARKVAGLFDLKYEEIQGSRILLGKLIQGRWDEDFLVIEPGGSVEYDMFL
jgi:hypothetical protein